MESNHSKPFFPVLVSGVGFEPTYLESGSSVLPLDEPPIRHYDDSFYLAIGIQNIFVYPFYFKWLYPPTYSYPFKISY